MRVRTVYKKWAARKARLATATGTPIYLGDSNHMIGMLESDFPKVADRFAAMFPSAISPLWIKERTNLFVYFRNKTTRTLAVFTRDGKMSYAVANLDVASVPERLLGKVIRDYDECAIFNARQVRAGDNTAYELVLDNKNEYIVLYTDEEEIVGESKISKQV